MLRQREMLASRTRRSAVLPIYRRIVSMALGGCAVEFPLLLQAPGDRLVIGSTGR